MERDIFKSQHVPVCDLSLWDENARFPAKYFNQSDQALIEHFISKDDLKIKELAKAIVADFDLPQMEKLIVYKDDYRFIVLEGNRRLTAYKLLLDPDLLRDNELQKFFLKLRSEITIDNKLKLECLITENKEQGLRYIDRKHLHRNNEVGWGDMERAHHNARRGQAKKQELLKIEISKRVNDLDIPEYVKDQVIGCGNVTTFFRIINSPVAENILGFKWQNDEVLINTKKKFNNILKIIIRDVIRKLDAQGSPIHSRALNKKDDIARYLNSINVEDSASFEEEISSGGQKDLFSETPTINMSQKRSTPKSTIRKYLIPRTCVLTIPSGKINNIYRELKHDLLLDDSSKTVPNAVGVLFRVFLELSVDHFLQKTGNTMASDAKLRQKIKKTIEIMIAKTIATQTELSAINKVASSKNELLSVNTFHEYVHSGVEQPAAGSLKIKWDNLQMFFEKLWSYLSKK